MHKALRIAKYLVNSNDPMHEMLLIASISDRLQPYYDRCASHSDAPDEFQRFHQRSTSQSEVLIKSNSIMNEAPLIANHWIKSNDTMNKLIRITKHLFNPIDTMSDVLRIANRDEFQGHHRRCAWHSAATEKFHIYYERCTTHIEAFSAAPRYRYAVKGIIKSTPPILPSKTFCI